jgi:antibiotic biosynthesis monooxygenase (ABM) superfamily enzyme
MVYCVINKQDCTKKITASKEVTVVVNRKIKPSCEKDYDEWLRRFLILGRKVPGYLGTTTIMETS